ncbi:MAG: hypothetical protein ACJ71D_11480 [Nitrososphaera sp.]
MIITTKTIITIVEEPKQQHCYIYDRNNNLGSTVRTPVSSGASSNYPQVLAQQNMTGTTTDAARTGVGGD